MKADEFRKNIQSVYNITAKNAWMTKQVSLVHVNVITLIRLYTVIHHTNNLPNNVGVHNFIY